MKILLVEDNKELNDALKKGLMQEGFVVDTAFDGEQARFKSEVNAYDIVILDLNLPKIDGITLAELIRTHNPEIPMLALTARDRLKSKLDGFRVGFDDYMTKPFEFLELLARVNSLIRRSKPVKESILRVGNISLNPLERKVYIENSEIILTKIEFNILEYLLRQKGITVKYDEIIEHIWGEDADLLDPPIRSHIKNLRRKIGDKDYSMIQTVAGVGYIIN